MNISMIGLDTSHTVEFTRIINGDGDKVCGLDGMRVTKCLRFPSPYQAEPDQDKRQRDMEAMGVQVSREFAAAVAGTDGIMVEINDASFHLQYMEKVVALGRPVFLDKPLAATLAEGRRIAQMVRAAGIPFWSASSLRFDAGFGAVCREVGRPVLCNVQAALGKAPAGSSVVWYGVHGAELVVAAMGLGARTLHAVEDVSGVVAVIGYEGGRRAVLELNHKRYVYSGALAADGAPKSFVADGSRLYQAQMEAMRDFFLVGRTPVPLDETLEVQAILNGIDRSLAAVGQVRIYEEN